MQNGNRVWIRGVLRQWNAADGARDLVPGGQEMYVDWESADDIVPETTIDKLSAYTKAKDFVLSWQGAFTGYTFQEKDDAISFSEPNFQDSPETIVLHEEDFQRDFYLRPVDDLIRNSTFEIDPDRPVNWITAGNLPLAVSDEDAASGRYALRHGPATLPQGQLNTQDSGSASLTQNVNMPAQMQEPTLRYMLRTAGDPVAGNSGLRLRIEAVGQREPTAITAPLSDD